MENILETTYLKMWMEEDQMLHCIFADKLEMDLLIAKQCVAHRITFSKGKDLLCLIDMKGLRSMTKDAREYMAKEGACFITASALLVESALSRMIGNIFLTINKPDIPVKLFTSEQEAKKWLMEHAGFNK